MFVAFRVNCCHAWFYVYVIPLWCCYYYSYGLLMNVAACGLACVVVCCVLCSSVFCYFWCYVFVC